MYHIVTIRDYNALDEFEIGATESVKEARRIANDELYRIERDGEKYETVEIRIYENENEQLDYNTISADGSLLKAVRESAGMTQTELANASGVKLQAVQHYEQGFRDLNGARAITVYQLAKALGCTVEDLLETE